MSRDSRSADALTPGSSPRLNWPFEHLILADGKAR
jgi:hypothetical protein